MTQDDLCFTSAVDLAALIRNKDISPVEVTVAFLSRIEQINAQLTAYVTVTADLALQTAKKAEAAVMKSVPLGLLHGVPFSVKDLIWTKDVRTTAGSLVYLDFVPNVDSIVVSRLKAAGGILFGKTNTPEFGYKGTTENQVFGDTRNPWALERTPGGSSGGAGAATAAGISPLSVGTDGGGSIRSPSSFSGIYGIKPTFGRVPSGPGFGGWTSISHTGPMTRRIADAAFMLDVIALPDEADRSSIPKATAPFFQSIQTQPRQLRIGWARDLQYAVVDPQVAHAVEQAVFAFQDVGWQVEEAHPDFDDPTAIFNTTIRAENYMVAGDLLSKHADLLDPGMRSFTQTGRGITALDYLRTHQERTKLSQQLAVFFDTYDLLVSPTLAVPPFVVDTRPQEIGGQPAKPMGWNPFTYPFNLTSNPAASIPCGWTEDGLPIGLQIVGRRFADALVLQASAAFERAKPWANRRLLIQYEKEEHYGYCSR